jgi:two-component system sensor histidine kinase/response regulator
MSQSMREPVRILIAEDDSLVAEVLRGLLEGGGFVVEGIAPDGRKAVEMAQRLRPDCIILDIRMPYMDGLEAARHIQKICPTPLVALTAYETPDLIQRANEVGISAYLVKPPDFREVERAIVLAMGRFTDMMELRRLNADLNAYAHTVAHDLINPLSGMTSSAEHLLSDHANLSPEELERYLDIILRSARKMNDIVNALLVLAETREADVGVELLDMSRIVTDAKELLSGMIEEHHAEFVEPETWPVALGNVGWVESAWVNYISNAVKYGGHPPRVELGADLQSPGMVRFWVADNGEGIPPDELEQVFVPFSQLGHPTGHRGHGLGLSIVQRSIDKLGGQVGVESELGKGSTFYFTLPAADDT